MGAFGNMLAQMATRDQVRKKLDESGVWQRVVDNIRDQWFSSAALKELHKAFRDQANIGQSSSIYSEVEEACKQQCDEKRRLQLDTWKRVCNQCICPQVAYDAVG